MGKSRSGTNGKARWYAVGVAAMVAMVSAVWAIGSTAVKVGAHIEGDREKLVRLDGHDESIKNNALEIRAVDVKSAERHATAMDQLNEHKAEAARNFNRIDKTLTELKVNQSHIIHGLDEIKSKLEEK